MSNLILGVVTQHRLGHILYPPTLLFTEFTSHVLNSAAPALPLDFAFSSSSSSSEYDAEYGEDVLGCFTFIVFLGVVTTFSSVFVPLGSVSLG